ncbi:hypothetical protein PVL30_005370 [Lodderomyces elongisporus]|uniref:uncharacterized protein n=1 Tax=Lodderomyces elongisporus TaxID=36914 RepID=UPI00292513C3|nr:uncharacterized protein PVL30_005370 [Lodderomyces elongisporus]WLF81571.1 hypothetical protein PVL30_005370 [Lodderomyces elongisporus]
MRDCLTKSRRHHFHQHQDRQPPLSTRSHSPISHQQSFIVKLKLSKEALSAIHLSQVKIKSPERKREAFDKRGQQISKYKKMLTDEQRRMRASRRKVENDSKVVEPISTSAGSPKRVKFILN